MSTTETLERQADADARAAVATDLDSTVFLEAGAGSGKTSCLVGRFVALVESGIPADCIAAITFTEKAAGELVDRIRSELRKRSTDSETCRAALLSLDGAAIGTLHSFAQRILTEHAIEAGLPPRFSVNDEIASQIAFETRWEIFADSLLDDPELEMPLRLLFASGGKPKHLRDVAVAFDANWDLVVDRISHGPATPIPDIDVASISAGLTEVLALADYCTDETDGLLRHLSGVVADFASRLNGAVDDDTRVRLLNEPKLKAGRTGRAGNWAAIGIGVVRNRLADLEEQCAALRSIVLENVLQRLANSLAQFTAESADTRQAAGELEFHDLLVLARNMLRHRPNGRRIRQALAQRYSRLLLDEFQDTDPIQIEIAALIASDDPEAGGKPWQEITIEPGRLFFVGDPKQSIYRFRRADIEMFMMARDELVGEPKPLSRNFRTGRPIIEWVNHTFAKLIVKEGNSQPDYQALLPLRDGPETGPPVSFFGREREQRTKADELRTLEAADVAATIRQAVGDGWSVADRDSRRGDQWRPAKWSDIAVLLPARTSLPQLERALDDLDIPFRAETSSLVYGTREVRELMLVARAVDDPTDSLAVVSALRTTAFACGDDDLFTWRKLHRGKWDHQKKLPDDAPADHPVALGIVWLCALHRERQWLAPSQVLDRILTERRFFELAAADRRPRDLWRRLRFVLDQCRAWEEAGGGTLREYLRWVEGQSAEGTRVVETVLPESDDEAVRILTVHGAKGLEFPIVILSGLTTQIASRPRGVEVRFPSSAASWAVKLSKRLSTSDFEVDQPHDEQMDDHERRRLLYVAATRACDHLVISRHRRERGNRAKLTAAELLHDEGWNPHLAVELDLTGDPPPLPPPADEAAPVADLPTIYEWRAQRDAALAAASVPVATSATRLAREAKAKLDREAAAAAGADPGLAKGAKDIDLPPWQKGRYGSAIGRAVHGVLQTVDLSSGEGLAAACDAQAAAEGVLGKEQAIETLARAALDSDVVKTAAKSNHWREVYVGVPWDTGVLEGYIDLLYERSDGLAVVDYKTDAWHNETELNAKVALYSVQLQAYADAVRISAGRNVTEAILLFLRPNYAVAWPVSIPSRSDGNHV